MLQLESPAIPVSSISLRARRRSSGFASAFAPWRWFQIWRTVRDQLLPRYTTDPATEGLGIYLVLWFGPRHTVPVPKGPRPQTPDDLRDRLLDSLTPEERRRAAVLVMDVTPPPPAPQ